MSKVITLEQVKNKNKKNNNEVILGLSNEKETKITQNEYIQLLEHLNDLNEVIEKQADEIEINKEEYDLLLKEYKDTKALVKKYQKQYEEKLNQDKVNEDYENQLRKNKEEAEIIARNRKENKYCKMTKEAVAQIALERHLQRMKSL